MVGRLETNTNVCSTAVDATKKGEPPVNPLKYSTKHNQQPNQRIYYECIYNHKLNKTIRTTSTTLERVPKPRVCATDLRVENSEMGKKHREMG